MPIYVVLDFNFGGTMNLKSTCRVAKVFVAILPMTSALFLFENCSGGFQSNPNDTSAASVGVSSTPTPTPTPTATGGLIGSSCTATSGSLHLSASVTRASGISPLLVFFDATATTDSALTGNTTAFQDVTYTWNFGDSGKSGTGTWAYGSNPNKNSKNTATGGVGAHLYIVPDGSGDTPYTATVTATDGTYTSSCQLGVTAYDSIGSNGFAGSATTCVYSDGSLGTGCPSGATPLSANSFVTALGSSYFGNGKRVLFKCGDTFTGDNVTLTAIKWSVGAYGGCQGTQTNQPIFNDTAATGNYQLYIGIGSSGGGATGDGRISDIYFKGNGTAGGAINSEAFVNQPIPYQITLWNLQSSGNLANYAWFQSAQWGLIGSAALNTGGNISAFFNDLGNNPTGFAGAYPNLNYLAILGNFVNGVGAAGGSSAGIEAMRTASCRLCLYENNTIENANNVGGVFKFNSSNTYQSLPTWDGFYSELVEISDNLFTGNSGGILSDVAPENGSVDERERNIVIERNVYNSSTNVCCETLLFAGGANFTIRDNAFYMPASGGIYPVSGVVVGQRGTGNLLTVQYDEVYNNTFFAPNTQGSPGVPGAGQQAINFDAVFAYAPPINSFAKNNMFYVPKTATGPTVSNTGTGNTVSNNTVTVTNNPGFTNGSGSFTMISDFKPTANYSGGTSVPVWFDALGVSWPPSWDLGAIHH
jgi:hypothetical protein